jgi:hypothetical protein
MVRNSDEDDDDHHSEDKELNQSVLEPALKEPVEAIFKMGYTPFGFAFDAVELLLQPVNAPGRNGGVWVVSAA